MGSRVGYLPVSMTWRLVPESDGMGWKLIRTGGGGAHVCVQIVGFHCDETRRNDAMQGSKKLDWGLLRSCIYLPNQHSPFEPFILRSQTCRELMPEEAITITNCEVLASWFSAPRVESPTPTSNSASPVDTNTNFEFNFRGRSVSCGIG